MKQDKSDFIQIQPILNISRLVVIRRVKTLRGNRKQSVVLLLLCSFYSTSQTNWFSNPSYWKVNNYSEMNNGYLHKSHQLQKNQICKPKPSKSQSFSFKIALSSLSMWDESADWLMWWHNYNVIANDTVTSPFLEDFWWKPRSFYNCPFILIDQLSDPPDQFTIHPPDLSLTFISCQTRNQWNEVSTLTAFVRIAPLVLVIMTFLAIYFYRI